MPPGTLDGVPELPEVEVVRRGLADHVVGRGVATAELRGARVARRHLPGPDDLVARLPGAHVESARRRGKYLWLVLAHGEQREGLVLHLGMSGQLLVEPADAPPEKHLHARLRFADGDPELRFVDQRTFGGLYLDELDEDLVPVSIGHIAPDLLETAHDRTATVRRIKAKDNAVKRVLLDQTVVSGIGNIYADEALWRARVNGERPASALTKPTIDRLLDAAHEVMTEALGQGGTSFDALYVNVNGASGRMTLDVYGREGRPCKRCGTPIVRERFMNRSSHFCPVCQRKR